MNSYNSNLLSDICENISVVLGVTLVALILLSIFLIPFIPTLLGIYWAIDGQYKMAFFALLFQIILYLIFK